MIKRMILQVLIKYRPKYRDNFFKLQLTKYVVSDINALRSQFGELNFSKLLLRSAFERFECWWNYIQIGPVNFTTMSLRPLQKSEMHCNCHG